MFGLHGILNNPSSKNSEIHYEKMILNSVDTMHKALQGLYLTLTPEELEHSKFLLKSNKTLLLQKQFDRIEELVKYHSFFNRELHQNDDYYNQSRVSEIFSEVEKVMNVEVKDIQKVLERILDSSMGIFHLGLMNSRLPQNLIK